MKTLVIVGPTASGKTALSLRMAKLYNGEIIAADSRTIYKGMNIGTAKPTILEMQDIKHFGLDLVHPNKDYNVSMFTAYAKKAMSHIISKGKLPIIVGGSGLFIDSLVFNFTFNKPDLKTRNLYDNKTTDELQEIIINKKLEMPNNHRNKRHLIATLEREGQPKAVKLDPPKETIFIGINPTKELLVANITKRAYKMIDNGVIEEAKYLFSKYGYDCNAFNGGIYKLIPKYINGEYTKDMLITEFIKSDTRLAKKQLTWFKRNKLIQWFTDTDAAIEWLSKESVKE